jgi:hypothetical protein
MRHICEHKHRKASPLPDVKASPLPDVKASPLPDAKALPLPVFLPTVSKKAC